MPQIQEYLPEVAAPEAFGAVSPNIQLSGAVGRGLQQLGGDIAQSVDVIHRRTAQQDTADAYSQIADNRSYLLNKIQQQTQDGSLDVDKITDEFDDSADSFESNLSTPEGRNFFQRQRSRLKAQILQTASHGMSQIAANDARGKWQDGINQSSSALMQDPSSFHDVYSQGLESIDQLVKTGGLPEKMRSKAELQMGAEFAKGSIRGWADLDPATAKDKIDSGEFDQFLNTDQKHQMLMEVQRSANASDVEDRRTQKAIEDEQKANAEKWGADNLEKLSNNALPSKDVIGAVRNGTLTWEQGEKWLNMIDQGTKKEVKTNPATKNNLIDRIVNPNAQNPIISQEDLMPYVGKGISVQDFNQLNTFFHKTPEQQAVAQGEKALFDSMAKTIRFKNKMTEQYDVLGEKNLAQGKADYIQAKKQVQAQGGNVSDLLNPNSPMYFGNTVQNYVTPYDEQIRHMAQDRTDKALGLRPTGNNPNPTPVKDARKSNESPADYLKRMGK